MSDRWPLYMYRGRAVRAIDGDTLAVELRGILSVAAPMARRAERDAVDNTGELVVAQEPTDERCPTARRAQVRRPPLSSVRHHLRHWDTVVGVEVSSPRVAALLAGVPVESEDARAPVFSEPAANQHHHVGDALPVGTSLATPMLEAACGAHDSVAPVAPGRAALGARRDAFGTTAHCHPYRRHVIPRWDAVDAHPSSDRAQPAPCLSGDLANGHPAVFIARSQPLAVLVGEVTVAPADVPPHQLRPPWVVPLPPQAIDARLTASRAAGDGGTTRGAGVAVHANSINESVSPYKDNHYACH